MNTLQRTLIQDEKFYDELIEVVEGCSYEKKVTDNYVIYFLKGGGHAKFIPQSNIVELKGEIKPKIKKQLVEEMEEVMH